MHFATFLQNHSCKFDRFLFEFKFKFGLFLEDRVLHYNFFEFKFDKNIKFLKFEFRLTKILSLLFDLIAICLYKSAVFLGRHDINKRQFQFTWLDQQKIFLSDNVLILNLFLTISNSFIQIRVQKNYFFEFGKTTEFFQLQFRVRSPALNH